jgi:hypothetical protein
MYMIVLVCSQIILGFMRILIVYKLDQHDKIAFSLVFSQQSSPLHEKYHSHEHCHPKFFFIYVLRYNLFIFNIMKLRVINELYINYYIKIKLKLIFKRSDVYSKMCACSVLGRRGAIEPFAYRVTKFQDLA